MVFPAGEYRGELGDDPLGGVEAEYGDGVVVG